MGLLPNGTLEAMRAQGFSEKKTMNRKRLSPGLSLAVVKEGRIVKTEGYGLANVEHNITAPSIIVLTNCSGSNPEAIARCGRVVHP
ncbi:MAG: hypothetical protein JMDDDDMK_01036 [Acidobacteria bacterium]|nr:hypothetical protein [Acidobacteriota bacterium]